MENVKIMVVAPDPGIRALVVDALSYCVNREVVSFDQSVAAWEYVNGHGADLVIADLDMPGMDGLELLKRFKSTFKETIFICMSGRPKHNVAEREGADGFLGKPFTIKDLFCIVQEYVVETD